MKYIFFVQSNVTLYLVNYYIKINKIQDKDIIVFYTRFSLDDLSFLPGIKLDYLNTFYRKFVNVNKTIPQMFVLTWATIRKINSFVKEVVKGDFVLVVPHVIWDTKQIFASHKNCKKVIYLEEGDMSYANLQEVENKLRTMERFNGENLRPLFSLGKLFWKHPFQNLNKNHEAICLHEETFPFSYIKKNVYEYKDVFQNDEIKFKWNYDNSVVLLLEHLMGEDEEKKTKYYSKLKEALSYIKNNFGSRIFIKPHPELQAHWKQQTRLHNIFLEVGIEGQLISDPIELLVSKFKDVKIFVHSSSLIRYCSYAGIKPFVWGFSMITEEEKTKFVLNYKFLIQHPELVNFID